MWQRRGNACQEQGVGRQMGGVHFTLVYRSLPQQIEYSISTPYFTSSTKHEENVDRKEEITLKGSPQR